MLRSYGRLRSIRKPSAFNAHRNFSVKYEKFSISQGGSLLLDFMHLKNTTLEISTAWQDHCEVEWDTEHNRINNAGFKFCADMKGYLLHFYYCYSY